MNPAPAHTPYDGSSAPFTIGLKALDLHDWIEIDNHLGFYLSEKERLFGERQDEVFAAETDTEAAQREVLGLLAAHLPSRFPETYERHGNAILIHPLDSMIDLDAPPPLWTAARLVPEDLVLMRRNESGWRLVAASLSFPSSWSLREKFGRTMTAIHEPVPDFGEGTRFDELINRMFDRLQPGNPVYRFNWSMQADRELFKPMSDHYRVNRPGSRFPVEEVLAGTFIRVERQTLRKLPVSGDILFTIRIFLDPLQALRDHVEGPAAARALAGQLAGLDKRQLDYKGLTADRDRLVEALGSLSS
jgi:hypothetical protein